MNNKDDSEMKNPLLPDENMLSEKFSRRSFMKGFAATTAAVSLSTILPSAVMAEPDGDESVNMPVDVVGGSGIYIDGGDVNMNGETYTLEFTQPVQLVAKINGVVQKEGTWRTENKHLVSVDPNGVVRMRDGVGGYQVEVTWKKGDVSYGVTFITGQLAGGHSIEVDVPQKRGDFMIRLAKYFGWYHYNNYMDDGSDIDDLGNYADERPRSYYDVCGNADYVKPIEAAIDNFVLAPESPEDLFYPMSDMTRQDAAVIIAKAFHLEALEDDYISAFADADQIDPDCYDALNTLVGMNFFRGRTNDTLNPTDAITDTEERLLIEAIDGRMVCPVWSMPVSKRKFVRARPTWFTATEGATVYWRTRMLPGSDISHREMLGLFIGDRGNGVTLTEEWSDYREYIPNYSTVPMFGLNNCYNFPYERVFFTVEVDCYAKKEGLMDSPHTTFIWRVDRPAWHDFAFDKLHEGTADYPTIYRYFDNFQAAAYYIEGSESGILYDGLMPTHTTTSLVDRVKEVATKPFCFVLGHNHVDHKGALAVAFRDGLDCYMADRVGPQGTKWDITVYSEDSTDANVTVIDKQEGVYEGDNIHLVEEGDKLDIGNAVFTIYRLPGHEDGMIILHEPKLGLIFASDIYGVNRYWVADQFGCTGVKQDLVLSLQQQLMDAYTKDGGLVKEVYTGHNRIGVGPDYMMVWEQALQDMVDLGPYAYNDDLRGDGAIVSRNGNQYETTNWQAMSERGKMYIAEYESKYDGGTFKRIELDHSSVAQNLYFDYATNAHLSDVCFADATLVGHDFKYKAGQNTEDALLDDGRLKFVIPNKFVPMDYEYDVKVKRGQETVTFTPVAMSNHIAGMTVNDKPASSRCPITVSADEPAVVKITGPDYETTETYVFNFIEDSNDALAAWVTRLYENFLGRTPDEKGLQAWVDALTSGAATGAKVVHGFVFSQEFQNNPLSNEDFVKALYATIFNREADEDGLKAWVNVLENGGTRKKVLEGFLNSPEMKALCDELGIPAGSYRSEELVDKYYNLTAFINRVYTIMFGRKATKEELEGYIKAFVAGEYTLGQYMQGAIANPAFIAKNVNNEDFIDIVYKVMLNRAPDLIGKAAWLAVLANGMDRRTVVQNIAKSAEFIKIAEKAKVKP